MPSDKHYVYSARTTEKGLALLNKTKGDRSWDSFINEAVSDHYKLDLNVIALPPSEFIANREKAKAQKAADKAAKVAKAAADKKAKADKKAADAKAKKDAAKKTGGKKTEPDAEEKPAAEPPKAPKVRKTVTVKPGETVKTKGGTRVTAAKENTHAVETPVED
jgi:sRNA-binding protein